MTRVRSEAARILNAAGATNLEEVSKPRHRRDVGDRPLSASGAFLEDAHGRVQGWFSVTFDGRRIPVTVFQKLASRGTWNTIVLGVDRKDYASDQDFIQRVQEVLRNEARQVPV
ncbi:hypothetical protein WME95_19825 [Sorangium sp. So ce327]|uniref:hypothetical protein n=1 Tax=Sorangium sp. So ce327 TaxID=3133301 RepID=UPI003F5FF085